MVDDPVESDGTLRMRLHISDLPAQLGAVAPVVVGVTHGQVLTGATLQRTQVVLPQTHIAAVAEDLNHTRIAALPLTGTLVGIVRATVIDHYQLDVKRAILPHHSLDGTPDQLLLPVGHHHHAHRGSRLLHTAKIGIN